MMRVGVIAGTHQEYEDWESKTIQYNDVVFHEINSIQDVLGIELNFLLYVGTCLYRKDFMELDALAQSRLRHA